MCKILLGVSVVLALPPGVSLAGEKDAHNAKENALLVFPVLFYTPETKWAAGAVANYSFREPGSAVKSRPSTLMPSVTYTQRDQIMSELVADLYWRDERHHLSGYIGYKRFPDKFHGIGRNTGRAGEESYTPRSVKSAISYRMRIEQAWYAGMHYEFEHTQLIKVEPAGLLARGDLPGSEGGRTSGLGLLVYRDTRDNLFYPVSGSYWRLTATWFNRDWGSDYGFNRYNLDVRDYLALSVSQVIAFHAYINVISGNPPFQKMSLLGGRIGGCNLMRGYYEGRFRDKHLMAFQMEYRVMPLWWKIGLVAFVAAGDVSDRLERFVVKEFKYSAGAGLRFRVNRRDKLNIRLDVAYGRNSTGLYITFGEAF